MPKCIACNCDLNKDSDIARGYCEICQTEIRTVFDKDAFALGQYKKEINVLDWTNYINTFIDLED
jgi:hypothetical protein